MAKIKVIAVGTVNTGDRIYRPGEQLELEEASVKVLIKRNPAPIKLAEDVDLPEDPAPAPAPDPDPVVDPAPDPDPEPVPDFREQLIALPEIDDILADKLIAAGFSSLQEIAESTKKKLTDIKGIGDATAAKVQKAIKG